MAIKKISIENFTVFDRIEIELCDGINVFIGENGTGKTHLLKVLYAFCESKDSDSMELNEMKNSFFIRLTRIFQISSVLDFFRNRTDENPILINITADKEYCFNIERSESEANILLSGMNSKANTIPATFIPAKEMLTHGGLEKDYADRNLPLDLTLIDILNKSGVSVLKNLDENMTTLRDKIAEIIGGNVVYRNDRYYIDRKGIGLIEFAVEAEGFKKFGLIYRLIETGHIKKGSVLIWDEPEANINPKLIPKLVDILLALSRHGVQVFLATHEYNLIKCFSMKKRDGDEVAFLSLYKTEHCVAYEREDDYDLLEHNVIIDANIQMLEDEIERVL